MPASPRARFARMAPHMSDGDGDPLKPRSRHNGPRPDRGQLLWSVFLNGLVVFAIVIAIIPIAALVRGIVDLVAHSQAVSGEDAVAYGLAFVGLFFGAIFFTYAIKYYLGTAIVLVTTLVLGARSGGNGSQHPDGDRHAAGLSRISRAANGNGNGYHIDLGYHPFVSIHVAAYNEKRVIERLLNCLDELDYPEYEVVVVDDSTDESVQILQRWAGRPRFKIGHRTSRLGFKGGALREALKVMDPRTEYVVIFDADSMPFPDSIERFLPYFYQANGDKEVTRRDEVAAVQSYQWHVLNKSESWLTEAVRAEYAGSYMVERPFQDAVGSLKMIAGTAYMIRADILREVGWGTSLTEDWELTLKLYARGYKVAYTPWAETPAECVSTFSRLARQRMRWAEGHTYNVRKWFLPIMLSPAVSPLEKVEFLFDAAYYLQAALFAAGTFCWLLSEVVLRAHIPGWTAALGWSLIFSNIFALPLMNLGGLILEDSPVRDLQGVLGALVLSFALVPFQGWAALKGLLEKEEGPWFRTPKTGIITDPVKHLRRLHMLRRWLFGPRGGYARKPPAAAPPTRQSASRSPGLPTRHVGQRWVGWFVAGSMLVAFGALAWGATRVTLVQAAGNPLYMHGAGIAPGCTVPTMDQLIGSRATPCSVQSSAGGVTTVFEFTNLPLQTVSAGLWDFTMFWTGGTGATNDTVTLSAGISATASCVGFVATVPNPPSTWTTTFGSSGSNTTSPLTVSTSASQLPLVIPAGGSLCLQVVLTHNTGGKPSMTYDGGAGLADTRLAPPTTVVPESLIGWLGLGLLVPLVTQRRRVMSALRLRK
ncbi:MAG: glycosyltransferase family 2 protein [Chloroflexi bacterium]|nr:MAG: glycosyltransferase family 2 protein [Chloroflexota bacterium]